MTVTVLLFADLRVAAGRAELQLPLPEDATVRTAAEHLERSLGDRRLAGVMVAVNEHYAAPATALTDGDVVAFLPPVSGG